MNPIVRIGLLAALSLLAACAGKDFVRPDAEAFRLGQSTYLQVTDRLGEPHNVGEVKGNDKQVKSISYAYAAVGGEALEPGVVPARVQSYYFDRDVLVGQGFVSSFKSDHSNFDDSKLPAIIKGRTTRAQVIELLGQPTATFIAPLTKAASSESIGYHYTTTKGNALSGLKFFSKNAVIAFDAQGVVSDIDFRSTGTR